jgi:transcriptional regulator GlxA family with amidase domain
MKPVIPVPLVAASSSLVCPNAIAQSKPTSRFRHQTSLRSRNQQMRETTSERALELFGRAFFICGGTLIVGYRRRSGVRSANVLKCLVNVIRDLRLSIDNPGKGVVKAKRIGLVGFDGAVAIDLAGPADAFAVANEADSDPKPSYEVMIIAPSSRPFRSYSGLEFKPQRTFNNAPFLDTLIVPGGSGIRKSYVNEAISAFIKARLGSTRRIASVCTGIYGLAATGLLAGRKVTTHWHYASNVARCFPNLQVNANAIFIKDGQFYTSGGATAGIDLALSLIEEDYGQRVSLMVARELVVYLKRSGGQEQYSEPLQFQAESVSRFSELTTWIHTHLNEDLSVEALAARACLCPRHFSRRFKTEVGTSPADFVERLRLDEARRRLSNGDNSVENVGLSVGFKSADAFRRAFERRLQINPRDYRRRFSTAGKAPPSVHQQRELRRISVAA